MQTYKEVMAHETTLPKDFNGTFEFTNWSDEDFVGKWGSKEYVFPAETTSEMIIHEHSPLEVQWIRKKFAKDLAEREFFKGNGYENLRRIEGVRDPITNTIQPTLGSMNRANSYNLDMLAPFIQKALLPLEKSKATVRRGVTANIEDVLRTDQDGSLITGAIKDDKDLQKLGKGEMRASMDARVMGK